MKKLILLLSLFTISFGLSAQYYYFPYILAGKNPGGINRDYEEPGMPGWAVIQGPSASPAWSPVTAIPIAFQFNGSPVDSFKVSTSGVLTFTTSAGTVPSSSNTTLPSASIPDNSICVWGLNASGANDHISDTLLGLAPHRQFWVQFTSCSFTGMGTQGWTYWGIVLEETTNNIYIVDQRTFSNNSAKPALTVGVQIDASTAVSVAGSPAVVSYTTNGGTLDDPTDNSFYRFIPGSIPANNMELTSLSVPQFKVAPSNINITGKVTNYGSAPVTSFTVKYQNGANVYSYTNSSVIIGSGQSYNFTHGTPFNIATSAPYDFTVWVELAGDADHSNDTLTATVTGLAYLPVKNIVFEEATGTWCGWCPRGAVFMDSLARIHPNNSMLIAVHDGDPMTVTAYDDGMGGLISGFPSGVVDRLYVDYDPSSFIAIYNALITDIAPVEVSVAATIDNSRHATITVSGHFVTGLEGDYRFNAVVTEDSVRGATSGYAQHNYYSYASQNLPLVGAGHNWQEEPLTVPANNMFYNHVGRAILGGFDGQAGSLPSTIVNNNTYQYVFNYTVPAGYNINRLKVIGWVSDGVTGKIYNSNIANSITGLNEKNELTYKLMIYPNPSTGVINIRSAVQGTSIMKLNVMNSIGETVATFDKLSLNDDIRVLDLSKCSNGLYFLQFTDEKNNSFVSKVVLNR